MEQRLRFGGWGRCCRPSLPLVPFREEHHRLFTFSWTLPNTQKKDDPLPLLYHFLSYCQFPAQNRHSLPLTVWTHGGTTPGSPGAGRVSSPNALGQAWAPVWRRERRGCVHRWRGADPQEVRRGQSPRTWSHQLRDENPGGEVPHGVSPFSPFLLAQSLFPFSPSPSLLSLFVCLFLTSAVGNTLPSPGARLGRRDQSPGDPSPAFPPGPLPAQPSGLPVSPRIAG